MKLWMENHVWNIVWWEIMYEILNGKSSMKYQMMGNHLWNIKSDIIYEMLDVVNELQGGEDS